MHPNPAFRGEPRQRNVHFARERGFGALAVNGASGPLVAHVPFVLSDEGESAELHLVRSNPIARAIGKGLPAVIAVSGPDSYISPDWYGVADQVPTWNYVAVHLRGRLLPLPQDALHGMLDRLAAHFEGELLPKPPWTSKKMTEGLMERMMRQIQPFRFEVAEVDGTWKLGQNKSDEARGNGAQGVDAYGIGQDTRLLAALMRGT